MQTLCVDLERKIEVVVDDERNVIGAAQLRESARLFQTKGGIGDLVAILQSPRPPSSAASTLRNSSAESPRSGVIA